MSKGTDKGKWDQETSLSRLQWLIHRSNVGYKGNPPPFETHKTQKCVELEKKRAMKKMAGDAPFFPSRRRPLALADDSRPTKHLQGLANLKFDEKIDRSNFNYFHQRLDKCTGRPEIVSALCWYPKIDNACLVNAGDKSTRVAASRSQDESRRVSVLKNSHLATLSPDERAALYREESVAHPKFTRDSREFRAGDAWYHGTQIEGLLHLKVHKTSTPSKRNCIRMTRGGYT